MKTTFIVAAVVLLVSARAFTQDKAAGDSAAKPKPAATATAEKPKPTPEELEAKFIATMTKATMAGRWT